MLSVECFCCSLILCALCAAASILIRGQSRRHLFQPFPRLSMPFTSFQATFSNFLFLYLAIPQPRHFFPTPNPQSKMTTHFNPCTALHTLAQHCTAMHSYAHLMPAILPPLKIDADRHLRKHFPPSFRAKAGLPPQRFNSFHSFNQSPITPHVSRHCPGIGCRGFHQFLFAVKHRAICTKKDT